MKDKLSLLKFGLISALLVLSSACGSATAVDVANGNANSSNITSGVNTGAANSTNANSPADKPDMVTLLNEALLKLPPPKPVENAKKQSHAGITLDVPADWKLVKKHKSEDGIDSSVKFQSPGSESEAIELSISTTYWKTERDLVTELTHRIKAKERSFSKIMFSNLNSEFQGILYTSLRLLGDKDWVDWITFPPPDSNGYSHHRSISISFPRGSYPQHEQLITDILFSAQIKKQ